ncbi:hypothetical protein [Eubacterium pyruvativorans]|uniref:hypothetical protein n=1 Tax=Eubacterium pyruvativorans TaxID=155865 RepID=UPI0013D0D7AA|nr:hypothetical protein [Eubacterium pyruvativorans]
MGLFRKIVGDFRSAFVTHCCGAGPVPSFFRAGNRTDAAALTMEFFLPETVQKHAESKTEIVIKEEK